MLKHFKMHSVKNCKKTSKAKLAIQELKKDFFFIKLLCQGVLHKINRLLQLYHFVLALELEASQSVKCQLTETN